MRLSIYYLYLCAWYSAPHCHYKSWFSQNIRIILPKTFSLWCITSIFHSHFLFLSLIFLKSEYSRDPKIQTPYVIWILCLSGINLMEGKLNKEQWQRFPPIPYDANVVYFNQRTHACAAFAWSKLIKSTWKWIKSTFFIMCTRGSRKAHEENEEKRKKKFCGL